MRKIQYLVVHCTATPQNATLASLRAYWKNVLRWKSPGYHYVIYPDGKVESVLPESEIANGVAGYNSHSIHLSYFGGVDNAGKAVDNRTEAQKKAIIDLLKKLRSKYPTAVIKGHRDFSPDKNGNGKVDPWERIKECPCFDAIPEYKNI